MRSGWRICPDNHPDRARAGPPRGRRRLLEKEGVKVLGVKPRDRETDAVAVMAWLRKSYSRHSYEASEQYAWRESQAPARGGSKLLRAYWYDGAYAPNHRKAAMQRRYFEPIARAHHMSASTSENRDGADDGSEVSPTARLTHTAITHRCSGSSQQPRRKHRVPSKTPPCPRASATALTPATMTPTLQQRQPLPASRYQPTTPTRKPPGSTLPSCCSCPGLAFYVDVVVDVDVGVDVGVVNVATSVQGEYPALLWDRTCTVNSSPKNRTM